MYVIFPSVTLDYSTKVCPLLPYLVLGPRAHVHMHVSCTEYFLLLLNLLGEKFSRLHTLHKPNSFATILPRKQSKTSMFVLLMRTLTVVMVMVMVPAPSCQVLCILKWMESYIIIAGGPVSDALRIERPLGQRLREDYVQDHSLVQIPHLLNQKRASFSSIMNVFPFRN